MNFALLFIFSFRSLNNAFQPPPIRAESQKQQLIHLGVESYDLLIDIVKKKNNFYCNFQLKLENVECFAPSTGLSTATQNFKILSMINEPKPPLKGRSTMTLADVAARAGVAISTVSRVVNRSPLVAKVKREHIESVIKEMGYRPTPLEKRKGIRKDPTPWIKYRTIRLIIYGKYDRYWITNYAPVYSYAIHGVEESIAASDLRSEFTHVRSESELLDLLKRDGADGFLILNTSQDELPQFLHDYPVVVFMGRYDDLNCDQIQPNATRAGKMAADYLYSKNCEYCIAIGGPNLIYKQRGRAFEKALNQHGIDCRTYNDKDIEPGGPRKHQANRALISAHIKPLSATSGKTVGIFSLADILTPVIYAEVKAAGFTIGQNLHIVTCNNETPYLAQLYPSPCVVDIQAKYVGERAVMQLLHRLQYIDTPSEIVQIDPKLILPEEFGG